MICLIGLSEVNMGVEMLCLGWQIKDTALGAQMVTFGLQTILYGMLVMT